MHRLLIFAAILGLRIVVADAQQPSDRPPEAQEVKEVVEKFYKLQAAGAWLGPERWDELHDFLSEVQPWSLPSPVSVLKSYQIGDAKKIVDADGTVRYAVDVKYYEWGSINSFLRFTKAQPTGEPVELGTGGNLLLTDSYALARPSGDQEEKKDTLRWRMRDVMLLNLVNEDAAIRWVSQMRDKSNDPAIKYNAEKTLEILRTLAAGAPVPLHPAGITAESPSKLAQRFVHLESRSLPDQWGQLTNYFVETPKPQWNHVQVVDVLDVYMDMDGQTHEGVSKVAISVLPLGELDSSLRLSNYKSYRLPNNNSACRCDNYLWFTLVLSDEHWQIDLDGTVKELDGPLTWRIEGTRFEPIITLNTAIRYVSQTHDKTTDPIVKKNAAKTLAMLKSYPPLSVRRHVNDPTD